MTSAKQVLKNRGALLGSIGVTIFVATAIFAPWIAPYDPNELNLLARLDAPSVTNWLGTDQFGRDIFSRIVWGSRTSLIVATSALGLSAVAGTLIGAVAGFYSHRLEELIMRFVDILLSFPDILLAIAITTIMRPGLWSTILAIGVYNLPQVIRVAHGSVLAVRERQYIEGARAIGLKRHQILFKYVLPNSLSPIVVLVTVRLAASIMTAAGLSFLGVGVQPPTPEWGAMISEARTYIVTAPNLSIFPGVAILLTVISLNLLGDGLNDVLNPRLKAARHSVGVKVGEQET